jgi:aspartyl-tRNA(Asn)/glutamyl-tRNA(Gln) amidotransferase subunit A
MGFSERGLPLSLQIAGRPFEESTILKVGDAYQSTTDWHLQLPAIAL